MNIEKGFKSSGMYNLTQLISHFACPNLRESKCSK
jgi:hypothetical protein